MSEEKNCLHCGDSIKGRVDKRFCDDQCRNSYHNQVNGKLNSSIRRVNSILKSNRRILEAVLRNQHSHLRVSKQMLINRGFRMNYHTHLVNSSSGAQYYFSYEYGILVQGEFVTVVKRESEF